VGLSAGACTPNWASKTGGLPVLLLTAINRGVALQSDVQISSGGVCSDFVLVRVENHFLNPAVTQTGFRHDLVINHYDISYVRSDGQNVQGVDVPYSISGDMASEVIEEQAVSFPLEVVRIQQKLEPPLRNLINGVGSGQTVLTVIATVTLYATTTTGDNLNPATGQLQIDFANFADTLTSCPPPPAG
jgi:hypothetical protein